MVFLVITKVHPHLENNIDNLQKVWSSTADVYKLAEKEHCFPQHRIYLELLMRFLFERLVE